MQLRDFVQDMDSLEDFFQCFGVPYDPSVVRQYRLHILKSFGIAVAEIERTARGENEATQRARFVAALRAAHDRFLQQPPSASFWGSPRTELVSIRKKGA